MQQCQETILFAFCAPSTSHCTNSHLSTLTWSFFLATKTLDGGSGRGEGTRQPMATKPVTSLPAAGGTGNFCLGRRAQCNGLAESGLHGVIDLFPSPSPPLPPLSLLGILHSPTGLSLVATRSSLCRIPECQVQAWELVLDKREQ